MKQILKKELTFKEPTKKEIGIKIWKYSVVSSLSMLMTVISLLLIMLFGAMAVTLGLALLFGILAIFSRIEMRYWCTQYNLGKREPDEEELIDDDEKEEVKEEPEPKSEPEPEELRWED